VLLLDAHQLAAVSLLVQAAKAENLPDAGPLAEAMRQAGPPQDYTLGNSLRFPPSAPVTGFIIRLVNRDAALTALQASSRDAVRELIRSRDLTNTVLFPPSASSSGQAFDAAVSITGLLIQENCLTPALTSVLAQRASAANRGNSPEPLETSLMDILSLGQRFDWGELVLFVGHINDPQTLDLLTDQVRNSGAQFSELFAAVDLTQDPDAVARYLNNFSQTGLADLGASLRYGTGGVDELLRRNERLFQSPLRRQWTASGLLAMFYRTGADYALRVPWLALALKWAFYLSSGFFLALAVHLGWPAPPPIEEPLRVRGLHLARELLFALGFLLVVLLLSEPFLAQESQKTEFPFRLRLPAVGRAVAGVTTPIKTKLMDTRSLLALLLFFVLQALIYCACRVKLAEIRRQNVPARFRLKLLENEEHLFDAGLYLGFAGTIVCLILVSLNLIQGTLMAAYSSTSFGIIFVSIFKIFNLRPIRRQLLLQAEQESRDTSPDAPVSTFATTA
jgi:hypothetical protein